MGPTTLALGASAVGEMDKAFELTHQACDERDPSLVTRLRAFRDLRRIRDDPRFAEIKRRLGITPALSAAK